MHTMKVIVLLALVASSVSVPAQRDPSKISPRDIDVSEVLEVGEKQPQSRIIGGQLATPHSFPYLASVGLTEATGTDHCGGSIISSEWILTAAHCLDSATYPAEVTLGTYTLYEDEDSQVTISSLALFQHPGWNKATRENDVGLIKLVKEIEFNAFVQPIRLPSRSQQSETYTGRQATLSGWGRASESSSMFSDEQRYVSLNVLSNSDCNAQFDDIKIGNSQLCTSSVEGKHPCNGDNGGPLVIQDSDGNGTQIGIASYGESLCPTGYPALFTKVSSYLDWISNTTGIAIRH